MTAWSFCIQIAWYPTVRKCRHQEPLIGVDIAHEYRNIAIAIPMFPHKPQDIGCRRLCLKARIRRFCKPQSSILYVGEMRMSDQLRLDCDKRWLSCALLPVHKTDVGGGSRIYFHE